MLYGRPRGSNPELLSVYNPPLTSGAKMFVRRARAMNYPLTVSYKGARYGFRELCDKFGIKKAAAIWRKYSAFGHGKKAVKLIGSLSRMHREHVKSRKHKKKATKKSKAAPKKAKRKTKKNPRKSRKGRKSKRKSRRGKSRKTARHRRHKGRKRAKNARRHRKAKGRKRRK